MSEHIERLVIEEEMETSFIAKAKHGAELLLVTQFGECEIILRSENVRNIDARNVRQIAENDSVSLVFRRAIQRGMIMRRFKMKYDFNSLEQIINEMIQLPTVATGEDEMKKKEAEILTKNVIGYELDDEKSFRNVTDFCNDIESYFRSPLRIEADRETIQKIGVGFSVIGGAAIAGFIANPFLALIGISRATSKGLVCLDGVTGAFTVGAAATSFINERLADSNYENALNFLVQEKLEMQNESLSATARAEITDLIDQDNIFSTEKALIKLTPKNTLETFENCFISKSRIRCKEKAIKKIKVIETIHKIRESLSRQCFIGVVGVQDAGKTTFVKNIWNVGGKSGYFAHT